LGSQWLQLTGLRTWLGVEGDQRSFELSIDGILCQKADGDSYFQIRQCLGNALLFLSTLKKVVCPHGDFWYKRHTKKNPKKSMETIS